MKFCNGCLISKDPSEFAKHKANKDGLQDRCKSCNREYRQRNREQIVTYLKSYHKLNKASIAAVNKAWINANREAFHKIQKKYRSNNRDKVANWAQSRRAKEHNQFIEYIDRIEVFNRSLGICGICTKKIESDFHVDHIIPLSKGGLHSYANVQAAHPECNLRKHNKIDMK